jgi:hypothetical protein
MMPTRVGGRAPLPLAEPGAELRAIKAPTEGGAMSEGRGGVIPMQRRRSP